MARSEEAGSRLERLCLSGCPTIHSTCLTDNQILVHNNFTILIRQKCILKVFPTRTHTIPKSPPPPLATQCSGIQQCNIIYLCTDLNLACNKAILAGSFINQISLLQTKFKSKVHRLFCVFDNDISYLKFQPQKVSCILFECNKVRFHTLLHAVCVSNV